MLGGIGEVGGGDWGAYPSNDFYVCGAGTVAGCDGVYDSENVSLHHANEVEVVFTLGYLAKVLNEIHNVCPVVHRVLLLSAYEALVCVLAWHEATYSF